MSMKSILDHIENLNEAAYAGNLGAVEMMRFYQIASRSDQDLMEKLLDSKQFAKAWSLLKRVTGVKLKSFKSTREK